MKTIFVTTAIALFVSITALSAQPLKIGVKGGVSSDEFHFSSVKIGETLISPSTSATLGYNMGLVARVTIPKFIHIQSELLYSSREYGYRITPKSASAQKVKITEQRLDLPVLVGFNISALRIFAGPVFTLRSSSSSSNKEIPFSASYYKSDIDLQLGAGLDIKKFFVDIRYTRPFDGSRQYITYGGKGASVKISRDETWSFNMGFFF